MKISYVFPSRSRPNNFFNCLENIRSLSESLNYEVVCCLDIDDLTMNNDEVKRKAANYPNVKLFYGVSKNKIAACNREVNKISLDSDIVCCHSDDMHFCHFWFDVLIRDAMQKNFPDTDGMLHFPDQKTGDIICTYQIVGKKYLERTGRFYHEDYESVFADKEETEKAKLLNKYAFIDIKILEHRHYRNGPWLKDKLMERNEDKKIYAKDRMTFVKRKLNNFDL